MNIRNVQPGQKFRPKASELNAIADAVNAFNESQTGGGPLIESGSSIVVSLKNNSSADLPRFGVLGFDPPQSPPVSGVATDQFKNRVNTKMRLPIEGTHEGRFAIAQEPVIAGNQGRFVVAGVTPAIIDVIDERHRFADIADGSNRLSSSANGSAAILWKESGLGSSWALLHIGQQAKDRFTAILGASTSIGTNQWRYAWQEARWQASSAAWVVFGGGLDSTTGGSEVVGKQSRNRAENGAGTHNAAAIPSGTVVEMSVERDTLGNPLFSFEVLDCGCL